MSHRQRLWLTALILGGVFLAALLVTPPGGASPASAQVSTPTPATATLTPTTTSEPPEAVQIWEGIKSVITTYGIWVALALLLLWLLVQSLPDLVKDGLYGAGRRIAGTVGAASGRRSGVETYLRWLKQEYGQLPQIGVATEQVQLDVESVHVPLRAFERDEAEAYQRQMRGEMQDSGDDGSIQRRGRIARSNAGRIFALLSDPTMIEQRRRREARRQWLSQLPSRLLRRNQRESSPVTSREKPTAPPATTERLLLLGGAGSGKTMTLRYAALHCAEAYRRGSARALGADLGLELHEPPLPIYARLTLFAQMLPKDLDALTPHERERYLGAPPDLFLDWLDSAAHLPSRALSAQVRRGGCLLLLDGLDESGSEAHRAYLTEIITNLADQCPRNRYVVASRTAGYGGRVYLGGFTERHLSPLDEDEARGLIAKWFRAVYARLDVTGQRRQAEGAEEQVGYLWGVIERNPRMFEMATNPLLATTMALLQFNNIKLPDQRAKLYEKLVELLLDLWRKTTVGNDTLAAGVAQLATEQRRIQHLALQMQLQPSQAREVTLAQAQAWLSPLYVERLKIDHEEADARVASLLESLSIDSGLIQRTQRAERVYSFSHYTFQEYLAARGLDALDGRTDGEDSVDFLLARCGDQRWRETLLLAAGQWSNGEQLPKTERLLEGMLAQETHAANLLVGQVLADIGLVEELTRLRNEVVGRLRGLAFDPSACPDARQRNTAAMLLDRLGADERPELDPARPGYWSARIEPGPFSMRPEEARRYQEVRKDDGTSEEQLVSETIPAFTAAIQRPYALARFPVTNQLYQRYLDDLRRRGEEEAWKERRPRTWPGRSYRPGEGSHPVTSVTWYDAMAFAAWLDGELRRQGALAPSEQIRLPLETEWERAAAYPAAPPPDDPARGRRAYPWGDWPQAPGSEDAAIQAALSKDEGEESAPQALPGAANTRESTIGATSVVGIFPNGRAGCGAEDMVGNVWEWCATAYHNYPLPDDLAPETLDTQKGIVLRGSSYYDNLIDSPCGAHFGYSPDNHLDFIGFRVARLFSSR